MQELTKLAEGIAALGKAGLEDHWHTCLTAAQDLWNAISNNSLDASDLQSLAGALIPILEDPNSTSRQVTLSLSLLGKILDREDLYLEAVRLIFENQNNTPEEYLTHSTSVNLMKAAEGPWSGSLTALFSLAQEKAFYRKIVETVRSNLRQVNALPLPPNQNKGRVLLLSQQVLSALHAPTRNLLVIASELIKNHGKEVMIVNTLEYGTKPTGGLIPFRTFAKIPDFDGLHTYPFDGLNIQFYQPATPLLSTKTCYELVELTRQFDPALIIAIGQSSLLGEVLANDRPVVMVPTGATPPLAIESYLTLYRPPTPKDTDRIHQMGLADKVIDSRGRGFSVLEAKNSHTRDQHGLPADAVVIAIVSNRMADYLTPEFASHLKGILKDNPNAFLWLLGRFDKPLDDLNALFDGLENWHYGAHQDDLRGAIKLADIYVNADTHGGGSTQYVAMLEGLAAYTLNKGDSAIPMQSLPLSETLDDLFAQVEEAIKDKEVRIKRSKACAKAAAELPGFADLTRAIVTWADNSD